MNCLLVLSAFIVGIVGLYIGGHFYSTYWGLFFQGTIVAVIVPLVGTLSLYLGIKEWKRHRDTWGYVAFMVATLIFGTCLGLSLFWWILD